MYGGFGIPNAMIHPGSYWWNPEFRNWPGYSTASKAADQTKATQMIKDAGLGNTTIEIACRDFYLQNGEFLNLTLKGLGTAPKINVMDQLPLQEMYQPGNYQVEIASFSPELSNQLLTALVTTNPINSNKHGDAKVDDYDNLIRTTEDPAERRKILREVEYYVAVDKAYAQPGTLEEAVIAFRAYIKGVLVPTAQAHNNDARYHVD